MAVLVQSVTQTNATTTAYSLPDHFSPAAINGAVFELNVTAAATLAGDTLNVWVQHSVDSGTNWDDLVAFAQVLGNGGVKTLYIAWSGLTTPTAAHAKSDGALTAGTSLAGPVGGVWRVKATTAGTGSFTFAVYVDGFIKSK